MNRLMFWCWGGIAVLAAVLGVVAYFAWPGPQIEPAQARQFRDYDLCMLTDEKDVGFSPASEAWSALQAVSLKTDVRASHLPVTGEQTPARASQFVATLVQQRCGVIVVVGENQVAGSAKVKQQFPAVTFVEVNTLVEATALEAKILPLIPPK